MSVYKHTKTGNLYFVRGTAVDATNARSGNKVVQYQSLHDGAEYVRDEAEFLSKFTMFQHDPNETLARQGLKQNALLPILIGTMAHYDDACARVETCLPLCNGDNYEEAELDEFFGRREEFELEMATAGLFRPFILKVQVPLASNQDNPPCLVYDESRTLMTELHIDPSGLLWLQGDPKMYVKARLWLDGTMQLVERVEDREW